MHSPAGIIYHICKETGWSWQYVLWGVPWSVLMWGLADAPSFRKEDPNKPKKGNPAEGRARMKRLKEWKD